MQRCFFVLCEIKKAKLVGDIIQHKSNKEELKEQIENAVAMAAAMAACVQRNRCALRYAFDSGKAAV